MKIAYVSRTLHTGLPEKMAMAVNQYAPEHRALALVPGTWIDGKRTFGKNEEGGVAEPIYNVSNEEERNYILEWADVIHCFYNTSLDDLGRPDLAKKKTVVWHLATRWNRVFESLFPRGPGRTRFVLSAEGWDRYGLWDAVEWQQVPVVFLLDHPAMQPLPFSRRTRHASMSIRVKLDTTDDGTPIAAPRSSKKVAEALKPLGRGKFRRIHGLDWQKCMRRKAAAWIGIDDVVNPLVHQSGFEYLALGVPCMNLGDEYLVEVLSSAYGCKADDFPFIVSDLRYTRKLVDAALSVKSPIWRLNSSAVADWTRIYAHPNGTIRRYIDLYNGARVT